MEGITPQAIALELFSLLSPKFDEILSKISYVEKRITELEKVVIDRSNVSKVVVPRGTPLASPPPLKKPTPQSDFIRSEEKSKSADENLTLHFILKLKKIAILVFSKHATIAEVTQKVYEQMGKYAASISIAEIILTRNRDDGVTAPIVLSANPQTTLAEASITNQQLIYIRIQKPSVRKRRAQSITKQNSPPAQVRPTADKKEEIEPSSDHLENAQTVSVTSDEVKEEVKEKEGIEVKVEESKEENNEEIVQHKDESEEHQNKVLPIPPLPPIDDRLSRSMDLSQLNLRGSRKLGHRVQELVSVFDSHDERRAVSSYRVSSENARTFTCPNCKHPLLIIKKLA